MTDKLTSLIEAHTVEHVAYGYLDDPDQRPVNVAVCRCKVQIREEMWAAHVAAAVREAFKPAAYVIGWYNQPPILDDIAVFPYDTPEDAASDAARNPDGIEWHIFALHEVPEGEPS